MDDGHIPTAILAPLTRMGERLAAVEARTAVEIAALKDDTRVIRSTLHQTNNTMQQFILVQTGVNKMIEGVIARFDYHVVGCEKRGARLEKAVWLGVSLLVAGITFLLKQHFFPGAGP